MSITIIYFSLFLSIAVNSYLVSMLCLFAVISLQWGMGSADQRMFSVISDQLFTVDAGFKNYNEEVEGAGFSKEDITDWLSSNVLDNIFTPDICGDDVCNIPNEYPYFQGANEMRKFVGCETDCGRALTKTVTVNFFDPWKLKAAYEQVTNAVSNGWNSGSGDGLLESSEYDGSDETPVAGWNICSRNLYEQGFFETVCLFDGDIFIDGLPYRTAELADGSDLFGESFTFEAFHGLWELRIAFDGFSWRHNGADVPIGFPSVRGEICVEDNTGDDEFRSSESQCRAWDPCPAARNCSCEWWQDGTYYCFEPEYFNEWDEKYFGFAQQTNLVYLSQWLGFNKTYESASTLNASRLDDDQWQGWACAGSGTHTFTLTLSNGTYDEPWDEGWDGYVFELYQYSEEEGTYTLVMSSGPTSGLSNKVDQYMCPEINYAVSVVEPNAVQDNDPKVLWSLTDTFANTVASGIGPVDKCFVYGKVGIDAYCQNSPTTRPSPVPTVIPKTYYLEDNFRSFNVDIWDEICSDCRYTPFGGGLRVEGTDFQHTVGTGQIRRIEGQFKFSSGDNPFLIISNISDYEWQWEYEENVVKVGVKDDFKYIKGQSESAFCYCPVSRKSTMTFQIEITSTSLTFTDDICASQSIEDDSMTLCGSTLKLKETIGTLAAYTMIGGAGIFTPSAEPTAAPTSTPKPSSAPTTPSPTATTLPTSVPSPMPTLIPTTSEPTSTPNPSSLPTRSPIPTVDTRPDVICDTTTSGSTTSTALINYYDFTSDVYDGTFTVSTCSENTNYDTYLYLYNKGDCGGTALTSNDDSSCTLGYGCVKGFIRANFHT